jgi:TPR repeat protein
MKYFQILMKILLLTAIFISPLEALEAERLESTYNMARKAAQGKGEEDKEHALSLYKEAARQGHVESQYQLGILFSEGKWIEKDDKRAFKYFKLAADKGHPDAQYNLGACYRDGIGVEKNYGSAIEYFTLAAKQKHEKAQANFSILQQKEFQSLEKTNLQKCLLEKIPSDQKKAIDAYSRGLQDCKEAVYYSVAANAGCKEAQYYLGCCYRDGKGVEEDEEAAFHYFTLATDQWRQEEEARNRTVRGCIAKNWKRYALRAVKVGVGVLSVGTVIYTLYNLASPECPDYLEPRYLAPQSNPGGPFVSTNYFIHDERGLRTYYPDVNYERGVNFVHGTLECGEFNPELEGSFEFARETLIGKNFPGGYQLRCSYIRNPDEECQVTYHSFASHILNSGIEFLSDKISSFFGKKGDL